MAILRNRTAAITASVHTLAGQVDGVDITRPVVPGTSPIALTLWHLPRTQDWLVQTCLRAEPEVVERFGNGLPDPRRYGFGTGLSPQDALAAAASVDVDVLLGYVDAVGEEVDRWLASIDESDLDEVPPLRDRQEARAAYTTEGALAEIAHLHGLPAGMLLLRPGISHLLTHVGEVDLLAQLARH